MSPPREVHHQREVNRAGPEAAPIGNAHKEATQLLQDPTINHGGLRDLPSNPTALAAAPYMEIAGLEGGKPKAPAGGDQVRDKDQEKIINRAAHELVDDIKNPKNLDSPTDRTYHRLEGLIQNEYKEHGFEGVKELEKSINQAFIKAQTEAGIKGPPKTFQLGQRTGDLVEGHVADPHNPQGNHSDFAFHLR